MEIYIFSVISELIQRHSYSSNIYMILLGYHQCNNCTTPSLMHPDALFLQRGYYHLRTRNNTSIADYHSIPLDPSVPCVGTSSAHRASIITVRAICHRAQTQLRLHWAAILIHRDRLCIYIPSCNIEEGVRSKLGATYVVCTTLRVAAYS
jgi:hypothetical protein